MLTNAIPFPAFGHYFKLLFDRRSPPRKHPFPLNSQLDEARNRRDFIHDVLSRNPEAFAGELDVQTLMQMYPDRF